MFIALLFHVSGAIGILFSPYKNWFIQNTPVNLVLMFLLLVITQSKKNIAFFLFILIVFIVGITVETIGVSTGQFFGEYSYGKTLGYQLNGVPILIGVNWIIVMLCCCTILNTIEQTLKVRLAATSQRIPILISTLSFVGDTAFLATLFDFIIEPVAIKLGYWQWHTQEIPKLNYVSWFVVSACIAFIYRKMNFNKQNQFAIHLFIIQLLFFLALRLYL